MYLIQHILTEYQRYMCVSVYCINYKLCKDCLIYPLHVTCDTNRSLFFGSSLMRAEHDPLPNTFLLVFSGSKATAMSPKSSNAFNQLNHLHDTRNKRIYYHVSK